MAAGNKLPLQLLIFTSSKGITNLYSFSFSWSQSVAKFCELYLWNIFPLLFISIITSWSITSVSSLPSCHFLQSFPPNMAPIMYSFAQKLYTSVLIKPTFLTKALYTFPNLFLTIPYVYHNNNSIYWAVINARYYVICFLKSFY